MTFLLERDGLDFELRKHIAHSATVLDRQFRQILEHLNLLQMQLRLECYAYHLSLTVRVSSEVHHSRTGLALCKVIFLVTRYTRYVEALHVVCALLAVTINDIVYCAHIILLEDGDMQDIRTDEHLFCHTGNLVLAVFVEDDDIIDIRTVEQEFVFLKSRTDEAIGIIDVQFLVGFDDGLDIDVRKVAHLCLTRIACAVLLLEHLEPCNRIFGQMLQVVNGSFDFLVKILHQFVGFLCIELCDTNHTDIKQPLDIFGAHLTDEFGLEGF